MNENERNAQIEELLKEIRERREGANSNLQMDTYAAKAEAEANPEAEAEKPDYTTEIEKIKKNTTLQADAPVEPMAQTTLFDRRSILNSIKKELKNEHEEEYDPINKSMIAPTIERGVDVMPERKPAKPETGLLEAEMNGDDTGYTEHHSIFSDEAYVPTVIPKENRKKERENSQAGETKEANLFFETGTIVLDAEAERIRKKGVLNVKDNVDDNFREFFGNTVMIDKETVEEKTKKQRKVKDFIFTDTEAGIEGGPVFEDEEVTVKKKRKLKTEVDSEELLADLLAETGRATLKTTLTGIFAGIMLLLNAAMAFGLIPSATALGNPTVFYAINLIVYIAVIVVNAGYIFSGVADVFTFRADSSSLVSFGALAGLIEIVVMLFTGKAGETHALAASVIAASVFMMSLGLSLDSKRVSDNFSAMGEYDEKYASTVLADQSFTRKITRDMEVSESKILIKRRTAYTDNYIAHAENYDMITETVSRTGSILAIIILLLGVGAYFKMGNIASAFSAMAFAAAMCSPFLATLSSSMPIGFLQNKLSKLGTYIPGYTAADEVREANCIMLTGKELFPQSNVMLHGIKTFERERVDKAILYAASVLIKSSDTMAHMFLNVIQNKTEMLYEVDGVEYESNRGFSFWVGKERILLGTRELLEAHDIEVPSRDYENRYTKTSTRDAIYLAVAGKLYAMFVVSYSPSEEVERALRVLERDGLNIVVHTRDFNLSPEKISKIYGIPKNTISVVREDDVPELSKRTAFVNKTPSSLTHIGSLISFVKGISACHRLDGSLRYSMAVELVSMITGAVLAAAIILFGNISVVNIFTAFLFQLVWLLVSVVGLGTKKI